MSFVLSNVKIGNCNAKTTIHCTYINVIVCSLFVVKVEDIISMTHFKSKHNEDQQILSRQTLPTAVYESYTSCHRPPALNDFTMYRDDGKEGLRFYTDPNYFYRLWVEEQNDLLEKRKKRVSDSMYIYTVLLVLYILVYVFGFLDSLKSFDTFSVLHYNNIC